MNNEELLDRYRLKLINLHLSTISVVTFLEIVAYIILHIDGEHTISLSSPYLWLGVLLPFFINFTAHFAARYVNHSKSYSKNTKNSAVIYAALTTSCMLALLHRNYITTACTFSFPIVLSGAFCDKKLLRRTLYISLLCLAAVTISLCCTKKIDVTFILNQIVVYGINIISYLSALLTVDFTQSNFSIIHNQYLDNRRLWHSVRRDQMTGLYNHVTFFSELESAVRNFRMNAVPFCLAMLDIDDFKKLNDTYGHDNGDEVILTLTQTMKSCCEAKDKVFRYGGEEFAILFIGKNMDSAKRISENILTAFSNSKYKFAQIRTTFSCGIVQCSNTSTKEELFNKADTLMYEAKQSGKNKIVI